MKINPGETKVVMSGEIVIDRFRLAHRAAVREIACATAFLDINRENILTDDEVLADILTIYFTDCEPESCFVALFKDKVVGYILGTKDVHKMNRILVFKIWPKLALKIFYRGVFKEGKNIKLLCETLKSLLKGEMCIPDFTAKYPAILHININEDFRASGLGSKLMGHFMDYLKTNSIEGVHLGTFSEKAKGFFMKFGFEVLFETKRSYLKYCLGREAHYYILGKRLIS